MFAKFRSTNNRQQEEVVMAIMVESGRVECVYQKVELQKYQYFEVDYQVSKHRNLTFFVGLNLLICESMVCCESII